MKMVVNLFKKGAIRAYCPLLPEEKEGNVLINLITTTDDAIIKEKSLQALRGVITLAGDKIRETIRKSIYATLLSMLSHQEDTTRSATAECMDAIFRHLPADELKALEKVPIILTS
jgi:hypothetical protein